MGVSISVMDEEEDAESEKSRFYDVANYKRIVDSQEAGTRPNGPELLLMRLASAIDSMGGLVSTFFGIAVVFGAPIVIVLGALYGPITFLVSFVGVIGVLGFYVERKLGGSIQVVDSSIGKKFLAQIVGCAIVLGLFYFIFAVVLKVRFA
jgi:class 3 adenylate cyclase